MNRQTLAIIAIIATGSIISGLAYGVTNGSIIVGDLTITGTCTGCGTEGSFTTYSLLLNQTVASAGPAAGAIVQVGNDGSVIASDIGTKIVLIKLEIMLQMLFLINHP